MYIFKYIVCNIYAIAMVGPWHFAALVLTNETKFLKCYALFLYFLKRYRNYVFENKTDAYFH